MLDTLRHMSMRETARKTADRSRDPKYLAKLVRDGFAIDLDDAKHVAKLIAEGSLKLGEGGPPLPELLEPAPRIGRVQAALRADRRAR
jgi:hypothetical protein